MPQARDEAGNVWEVDAQGNAIRFVSGAQRAALPVPRTIPLPESPGQRADRERDAAAAGRDEIRTGIAARGEGRDISKTAFQQARDLREEFTKLPQVREYQTVIRQYSSALKTQPTPTGDQALITAYAKMLDPGSVVREQEFNTVAAGDSTIGQAIARLNKELGTDQAGLLRPEVRARVRDEMLNLAKSYNQSYTQARDSYGTLAQRNGFDPADVVGPHYGAPYMDAIERSLVEQRTKRAFTTGPDGKRVEFDVPAGADDAAVREAAAKAVSDPRYRRSEVRHEYGDSFLSQGMSGINEGIANALGLPVDLTTEALNLVPRGINAIANTNLPEIREPFLGSQHLKGIMDGWAIGPQSDDGTKQFMRRVGQSIGSAAVPVMGSSGSLRQLGRGMFGAAGGGVGAATAQQVFPGNPVAEFAGELAGGGVASLGSAALARRAAQRQIEANIPTVEQLKQQAGELYRQAESRGITADPTMTQDLADRLRQSLADDGRVSPTGRISEVYPKAREAVQLADDYAGSTMNPTQMQTVRGVMADGLMSADATERRIGRNLTDTFDAWANPQAPELAQARNVASRYLNAKQLELARELAAVKAGQFTGSGYENALRTEYRALDRNAVKGNGRYGADLETAIENVSRGTPASNIAREIGKFAPRGVVSFGLGGGVPAAIGGMIAGPAGAAIGGGGAMALGEIGRAAATRMALRNADIAELVARNGGAIPQAPLLGPQTEQIIASILTGATANANANTRPGMFGSRNGR